CPTTRKEVRRVTDVTNVPPWARTSSAASGRVIEANCPVNATRRPASLGDVPGIIVVQILAFRLAILNLRLQICNSLRRFLLLGLCRLPTFAGRHLPWRLLGGGLRGLQSGRLRAGGSPLALLNLGDALLESVHQVDDVSVFRGRWADQLLACHLGLDELGEL